MLSPTRSFSGKGVFLPEASKWTPMILTLLVLPGMGHLYLKKKFRGYLFGALATLIFLASLARYFSVLFALVHKTASHRVSAVSALELVGKAIRLDFPILAGFIAAFLLVWLTAFVDLIFLLRARKDSI
jgi:hypothetical protein